MHHAPLTGIVTAHTPVSSLSKKDASRTPYGDRNFNAWSKKCTSIFDASRTPYGDRNSVIGKDTKNGSRCITPTTRISFQQKTEAPESRTFHRSCFSFYISRPRSTLLSPHCQIFRCLSFHKTHQFLRLHMWKQPFRYIFIEFRNIHALLFHTVPFFNHNCSTAPV